MDEYWVSVTHYPWRTSVPNGFTTAARSKIEYGMLAFSSRAPRNRPPRPAPTMRMVGLSFVDMVG